MTEPHEASADVAYADVAELRRRLADGSLTSEALVRGLLDRISAIDAADSAIALRSILAVSQDAIADARRRDKERAAGIASGPLHGIPVVVKDNIEAVGLPCTAGSLALVDSPVHQDAPLVARLRDAGAIVMAATNLSEWANIRSGASTSGWSAVGGLTGNPWALDRSPGGSSAGSGAALAAGLAPLAIGTETDGSIVCPASVNGVVGLKPTVGRLSTDGIVPISHSQDTPGPMARNVRDVALLWEVLSGEPVNNSGSYSLAVIPQWRSGYGHTDALFDDVVERIRNANVFTRVGSHDVPEMGTSEHADELRVLLTELYDGLGEYLQRRNPASGVKSLRDVVAFNLQHADVELQHFGQELFDMALEWGGVDEDARAARTRNLAWSRTECLDPAFANADFLLAPTYAPAWKSDFVLGHPSVGGAVTSPAALAGYPLLTLPMGLVQGLPVGICLVGRPNSEAQLLHAAALIEAVVGSIGRPRWAAPARG
jgi:amidase